MNVKECATMRKKVKIKKKKNDKTTIQKNEVKERENIKNPSKHQTKKKI